MKRLMIFTAILLTVIGSGTVFAQTRTPRVDAREHRQKARIREGVRSGELTPRETRRLKVEEGKIKADEMKAKSDGKVTPAERRKLNKELNRSSRDIYRLKHNNRVRR